MKVWVQTETRAEVSWRVQDGSPEVYDQLYLAYISQKPIDLGILGKALVVEIGFSSDYTLRNEAGEYKFAIKARGVDDKAPS